MKIKRGSVTPVDLTGQASGDYIRNDAGVYKPSGRSNLLQDALRVDTFNVLNDYSVLTSTVTGSGTISRIHRRVLVSTGVTDPSSSLLATPQNPGWQPIGANLVNFNKTIIIKARMGLAGNVNELGSERFVYFGSPYATILATPLTSKGFGFKMIGSATVGRADIYAFAHDGTSETLQATGQQMVTDGLRDYMVIAKAGTVEWYINNTLYHSITTGPTGEAASHNNIWWMAVSHAGTIVNNIISCHDFRIYVEA